MEIDIYSLINVGVKNAAFPPDETKSPYSISLQCYNIPMLLSMHPISAHSETTVRHHLEVLVSTTERGIASAALSVSDHLIPSIAVVSLFIHQIQPVPFSS